MAPRHANSRYTARMMAAPPGDVNPFAAGSYADATGHVLPYRLLTPERSEPGVRYPLVLVLHGAGERGTDNTAQLGNGIGALLQSRRRAYPSVALVPQCAADRRWVEVDWSAASHQLPSVPSAPLHAVLSLVEALLHPPPRDPASGLPPAPAIDPARLYLVGLSMGGYGVWDALSRQPQRFAAAVPICGGAAEAQAALLCAAKVPVWAFHGALDPVVPVERSRKIVTALRRCGGPARVRYTEYADVAHDAWLRAFAEPELWPWLFAQRNRNNPV